MIKRGIIWPDTHAPYHDKHAVDLVLSVMIHEAFDRMIHLGDLVDNYAVSRFTKDPTREQNLKKEYKDVRKLVERISELVDDIDLLEGNHERRLPDFLSKYAPQVYELVQGMDLFGFQEHGWTITPYYEVLEVGHLQLTHDVGRSGINSTRLSMRDAMDNLVIGHNHNMAYHVEAKSTGVAHVGASFGWLGDVEAVDYMHKMKARNLWTHGFGTFLHDTKTGVVYVTPHPIIEHKKHLSVAVNGTVYEKGIK